MSTFARIVETINAAARDPGAATPPVCEAYRAHGDEGKLLINAILPFETKSGRRVKLEDESTIMERVEHLKVQTAEARNAAQA